MAQNPVIMLGLVLGVLASIIEYRRSKSLKDSILALILMFLASGTPLHFLLVGFYLGSWVNRRVYLRWSSNWGSFMASLLGVPVLFAIWQAGLKLLIAVVATSVDDAGGGIVLGIGVAVLFLGLILVGLTIYVLSSFYTSFRRGRNLSDGAPIESV